MAVGAHADDIELNVGGTLVKYRESGYAIAYVMSTNNMSGDFHAVHPDGTRETTKPSSMEMINRRRGEAEAAAAFFGTKPIFLDHPQRHYRDKEGKDIELRYGSPRPECVTSDLPTILTAHEDADSVRRLSELIIRHSPEAVMTHGPIMLDMEHVGTCLLVTKAYLKARDSGYGGMLLHWLDISPTIFGKIFTRWESHIDISGYQEKKIEAIGMHACQMPTPSKLDFPPIGAACGCSYAEAFTIGGYGNATARTGRFTKEILENKSGWQ